MTLGASAGRFAAEQMASKQPEPYRIEFNDDDQIEDLDELIENFNPPPPPVPDTTQNFESEETSDTIRKLRELGVTKSVVCKDDLDPDRKSIPKPIDPSMFHPYALIRLFLVNLKQILNC